MRNKRFKIIVAKDLEDLSQQSASWVAQYLLSTAKVKDRVSLVLSGGTTPKGLYERLADEKFQRLIPWRQVHLFWGDERCVSPEHVASNYRLAYETFISRVPIPSQNVHPMPGADPNPERAAEEYEKLLRQFFGWSEKRKRGWPRFDLIILGVGLDGHTASLFPKSPVLREKKRWVAAPFVSKLRTYRLTLTPPILNYAAQVIFLASGSEKAAVLKKGLTAGQSRPSFPYRLIRPLHGRLIFFLDTEAASQLASLEKGWRRDL
jgi:6-phosphogluconolactonase